MSNYDSVAERDSIFTRLLTINGGNAHRGAVEGDLATFPNGTIKPYSVVRFGRPVPAARGRGLGGARVQPYIMPVQIYFSARNVNECEGLATAAFNLLLGWTPAGDNAGELTGGTGQSWQSIDTQGVPVAFNESLNFETIINLSPAFV